MEEKIFKMIYKKNCKITQDYIENQVQKVYRELNVFNKQMQMNSWGFSTLKYCHSSIVENP